MSLILDHPQQPPEGHSFRDGSGVVLQAKTLKELLATVARFRSVNGLPPGNPHAEIEADYRIRLPWLVSKVGVVSDMPEDPVARWLNRAWRSPIKEREFADSVVTQDRLAVCAGCPHYHAQHLYSQESRRRLTILGVGRIQDEGACAVHHWPVGLAALYPKPESRQAVDGCWASGIVP